MLTSKNTEVEESESEGSAQLVDIGLRHRWSEENEAYRCMREREIRKLCVYLEVYLFFK